MMRVANKCSYRNLAVQLVCYNRTILPLFDLYNILLETDRVKTRAVFLHLNFCPFA